jgi:hypothetical protein
MPVSLLIPFAVIACVIEFFVLWILIPGWLAFIFTVITALGLMSRTGATFPQMATLRARLPQRSPLQSHYGQYAVFVLFGFAFVYFLVNPQFLTQALPIWIFLAFALGFGWVITQEGKLAQPAKALLWLCIVVIVLLGINMEFNLQERLFAKPDIPNAEHKTFRERAIDKAQERRKIDGEWVIPDPVYHEQLPNDLDRSRPDDKWTILGNSLIESQSVTVDSAGYLGMRCYEFPYGPPEDRRRFFLYMTTNLRTSSGDHYTVRCGSTDAKKSVDRRGETETVYVRDDNGVRVRVEPGTEITYRRSSPKGGKARMFSSPDGRFATQFKPPQLLLEENSF